MIVLNKKTIFRVAGSIVVVIITVALQSFAVSIRQPHLTLTGKEKCDSIPPLNKEIIDFAHSKLNHKVGLGECWDLAAEALESVGAKWDHEYKFGRLVDPSKECVFAGDIIQFEKVRIVYTENNTHYREKLPHHTAIIYEVDSQDSYTLIEQNTGRLGQKVGVSPLKLSYIVAGKYKIYRPVK